MAAPHLVLASASPRRRQLLTEHGYGFTVAPADVSEIAPLHLTPGEIVLWNARAKAHAIARRHPRQLVLGVDTVVAFEGRVFGKPRDLEEAFAMLQALAGHTHEVFSGVCLVHPAARAETTFIEITRVHFHPLSDAQIRRYLTRIDPLDKAGSYAAQNDNGELIARLEGSLTNVIGLPMEALAATLRGFGRKDVPKRRA